jgi:hypothetical protein
MPHRIQEMLRSNSELRESDAMPGHKSPLQEKIGLFTAPSVTSYLMEIAAVLKACNILSQITHCEKCTFAHISAASD